MTPFRTLRPLALLALFVLFAGQPAAAQDAQALFARLKAKYDAIDAVRARFTQTMTSAYTDDAVTTTGTLVLRGAQYRVETGGQTLVNNGKVTWVYLPAEKQVLINDYDEEEALFSINDFFFNYAKHFTVSRADAVQFDRQKHYVLKLQPKNKNGFFREATLWMRDRDNVVTQLKIVDVNDTTMLYKLQNIELNPKLDNAVFSFTPPKGTEVIDLRSE